MNNTLLPSPYPVNALHAGIRDAVLEVQANLQAPDALIAGSFLTAMSSACQSDVEVELPTGQVRPVCLNILTIADSGERKTTTDSVVCAPIYDHDARQASVFAVQWMPMRWMFDAGTPQTQSSNARSLKPQRTIKATTNSALSYWSTARESPEDLGDIGSFIRASLSDRSWRLWKAKGSRWQSSVMRGIWCSKAAL